MPKPIPLIITANLVYEPNHQLVFDRRTYYDSRPLCFGHLLSMPDFFDSPLEFRREWREIVVKTGQILRKKLRGK